MIHRAILGSVERMIAVLTENFGGKWPFWLSPRQVMVVPVGPTFNEYAANVRDQLKSEGYMCEADLDNSNTMNKKVRNAQLAQYNFIFVVGKRKKKTIQSTFVPETIKFMENVPLKKSKNCSANWPGNVPWTQRSLWIRMK